jgi:biotin-dependent carboxylase-like uncharacterized protein
LQDIGRPGFRSKGVPSGGAFDRESFQLSNALLGNPLSAPVVEIPMMGGRFEAVVPTMAAIVGADCRIVLNDVPMPAQCRFAIAMGEVFELAPAERGARAYLALPGGIHAEMLLGSAGDAPVKAGDVLNALCNWTTAPTRLARSPESLNGNPIRYVPGPQSEAFDLQRFDETVFTVSHNSNRAGIRLNENFAAHAVELPSEPACPGAIQVPPSGAPIVLGPDGPTIGGYPKIAVVIDADISRLAQLRPGGSVQFQGVTLAQARKLTHEWQQRMTAMHLFLNSAQHRLSDE